MSTSLIDKLVFCSSQALRPNKDNPVQRFIMGGLNHIWWHNCVYINNGVSRSPLLRLQLGTSVFIVNMTGISWLSYRFVKIIIFLCPHTLTLNQLLHKHNQSGVQYPLFIFRVLSHNTSCCCKRRTITATFTTYAGLQQISNYFDVMTILIVS